jgi:hypothetical protein
MVGRGKRSTSLPQQRKETGMDDKTVKVCVSIGGQYIEVTRPMGWGGNPAFYAGQVERALDDTKVSIRGMIEAEHGPQSESEPANGW